MGDRASSAACSMPALHLQHSRQTAARLATAPSMGWGVPWQARRAGQLARAGLQLNECSTGRHPVLSCAARPPPPTCSTPRAPSWASRCPEPCSSAACAATGSAEVGRDKSNLRWLRGQEGGEEGRGTKPGGWGTEERTVDGQELQSILAAGWAAGPGRRSSRRQLAGIQRESMPHAQEKGRKRGTAQQERKGRGERERRAWTRGQPEHGAPNTGERQERKSRGGGRQRERGAPETALHALLQRLNNILPARQPHHRRLRGRPCGGRREGWAPRVRQAAPPIAAMHSTGCAARPAPDAAPPANQQASKQARQHRLVNHPAPPACRWSAARPAGCTAASAWRAWWQSRQSRPAGTARPCRSCRGWLMLGCKEVACWARSEAAAGPRQLPALWGVRVEQHTPRRGARPHLCRRPSMPRRNSMFSPMDAPFANWYPNTLQGAGRAGRRNSWGTGTGAPLCTCALQACG